MQIFNKVNINSVPRIAVAFDRNQKFAVAVAAGSLTENKNFAKFFRKRKRFPLLFLGFKVVVVDACV